MDEERMNELLTDCLKVIHETSVLNKEAAQTVKQLSHATTEQTKTFVLQINKLSKRLDAAEKERQSLIKITDDQNKRIDRLMQLLHDAITKQTNFIQQQ